jgi:UV DNA damage endonuclease
MNNNLQMSQQENKPRIRLGLCCLNTILREQKPPIFMSRSCIQATAETKGLDYVRELAKQNLLDMIKMIQWNYENGIEVFRLSSEIFPHITNQRIDLTDYRLEYFDSLLKRLGNFARQRKQRLTFHPGQFNVLGSPNKEALKATFYELHIHATILDKMGCDQDSVMVIHGGGVYGNKQATMDRWCKNYMKLPENVRNRLVLENCEKNFSIEDCLEISKRVGVPVVLDNHHFFCYNILHKDNPLEYRIDHYIPAVLETWRKKGIRPKFHISEQGSGKTGHHSDYISAIPDYYLEIPEKYNVGVDIMVEAKMKEQAILQLYNLHKEQFLPKE